MEEFEDFEGRRDDSDESEYINEFKKNFLFIKILYITVIAGIIERSIAIFGITFIYQFTPLVIVSIAALFVLLVSQREIFYPSDPSEIEKKARKRVTAGLACITAISLMGTLVVYDDLTSLIVILFGVSVAFGVALCYSKEMNLRTGLRMLLAKDIRIIHTSTKGTKQIFSKSGLILVALISATLLLSDAAINALISPASSGLTLRYILPFKYQSILYIFFSFLSVIIFIPLLLSSICLSMYFLLDSSRLSLDSLDIGKIAKSSLMTVFVHLVSFIMIATTLLAINYLGVDVTDFSFYMTLEEAFHRHLVFFMLLITISIAFSIVFAPFDILAGTESVKNQYLIVSNSPNGTSVLCSVYISICVLFLLYFLQYY